MARSAGHGGGDDGGDDPAKVRIFVAYARADHAWRQQVENQLGFLRHHHRVDVFSDQEIEPGEAWDEKIRAALAAADIFVPLLSAAFAGSAYCNLVETKAALDRYRAGDLQIIPILIDHVDHGRSPFGHLQMLPNAEDGRLTPVADWPNRALALKQAAERIGDLADAIRAARRAAPSEPSVVEPPTTEPVISQRAGCGYRATDRNVLPECAELLLSATQGSDATRICLNAELRCGAERLRHGRRSFHLRVKALRLRLLAEGCTIPPGPGLGDAPPENGRPAGPRVRRRTHDLWEVRPPADDGALDGYVLGADNLADLEVQEAGTRRVEARLSAYAEHLDIEVAEHSKAGPCPKPLGKARAKLLKLIIGKAIRQDGDELFLSDCHLEAGK